MGGAMGWQGPDQGYALSLADRFVDRVLLEDDERFDDAAAGCVHVAMKRASLYGRAPVIHDLEIAFRLWGFLDVEPAEELVSRRKHLFCRRMQRAPLLRCS